MSNPFESVDIKKPTSFLTEISDKDFFKELSDAPNAEPNTTPQSQGINPNDPNFDPNYNPNLNGGAPINFNGQTNVNIGQFINGKTGVAIVNIIVPLLLSYMLLWFMNKNVKRTAFELSASEKATLEPIVDACIKSLNINFNSPWVALAIVGGTMYTVKFAEVTKDSELMKAATVNKDKPASGLNKDGTPKKDGRGRPSKS